MTSSSSTLRVVPTAASAAAVRPVGRLRGLVEAWRAGYVGALEWAELAALDEAIGSAKGNLRGRSDMEALERLKGERDALKRAIRDWND